MPCRVGLVVSISASHAAGRWFVSRPGHTKDHQKLYKLPPCTARNALGPPQTRVKKQETRIKKQNG